MSDVTTRLIEVPPGFPVTWPDPGDAMRLWERELMHLPGQSTALDHSFTTRWIDGGFNAACADFSLPVRNAYRRINTYMYQSIAPISHDPAELEALGGEAQRRVGEVLGRQVEMWEGERLPEIKGLLARWDAFDLDGASDGELLAHLADTVAWSTRAWHIHFQTAVPLLMSMSLFQDFVEEVLGGGDIYRSYRMLAGQDNWSLRVARALQAVSRVAARSPEVVRVLQTESADRVVPALRASGEGEEFLTALDAFLQEHGRRGVHYLTISIPSLVEDPAPLIVSLQDATAGPDRDLDADLARSARDAAALAASAREQLGAMPEAVRGQFEFLLDAARQGSVMQEDHNYWIDCSVTFRVRMVALAVGRRLQANGAVDDAGDVFHLRIEELADLATDRRALVAERKAEMARFADVVAPPVLGSLPPGPPPDDPVARAIFRMFGGDTGHSGSASEIRGLAGSPGVARGRVRLIRSFSEGDRLQQGEVLVAPTTAPPWTPLFGRAAAIVTDTGGILSHCAVVAREYAIPAVVGTRAATANLHDGQLVEVDGDQGVVRVVEE